MSVSSSEYLSRKKREAARLITQPQGRPSSLRTQIVRYACGSGKSQEAGGSLVRKSADPILATKGHAGVCCVSTISEATWIDGDCKEKIQIAPGFPVERSEQPVVPRGFYKSPRNAGCLC
jgi:hypothetical protein